MSKHPRLMRRGAVYYFRCKIPTDLIDHYDKREIVESLRTKNATEALRKVRKRSEAQEQEFDRVRAGKGVSELAAEVIEDLARRWAASVLSEDEVNRIDGTMKAKHVLDEDIGRIGCARVNDVTFRFLFSARSLAQIGP